MRVRAGALIVKDGSLLLVKHTKNKKTYWLLPGGGVKLGEPIKSALKREISEEINLQSRIWELIFVVESFSSKEEHIIQPTYYVEVLDIDTPQLGSDGRITDFGFFRASELDGLTIYPDIKDELKGFLGEKKQTTRYVYKKWIN